MNLIYIFGFIWGTIALIGITNSLIYKCCKRILHTGARGSKFQCFYVYKFHHRLNRVIYIANLICGIIGCCILCVYIVKSVWYLV